MLPENVIEVEQPKTDFFLGDLAAGSPGFVSAHAGFLRAGHSRGSETCRAAQYTVRAKSGELAETWQSNHLRPRMTVISQAAKKGHGVVYRIWYN